MLEKLAKKYSGGFQGKNAGLSRGQLRTLPLATRAPVATDADLAADADRALLPARVEHAHVWVLGIDLPIAMPRLRGSTFQQVDHTAARRPR